MKAYCNYCNKDTECLGQGFSGNRFKCAKCHNQVRFKRNNWAIYIAVFSLIATLLLLSLSMALEINPYPTNPANGSTINTKFTNLLWNVTSSSPINGILFNSNSTLFDITNKLVIWYQFNNISSFSENSTYVVNLATGDNNLTVYGGLEWDKNLGRNSGGFNFTGTNYTAGNFRMLNGTSPITANDSNWTISIWVYPKTETYAYGDNSLVFSLFGYSGGIKVRANLNCFMNMNTGGGDITPSAYGFCPLNQWTNIVGIREGNRTSIYTNGILRDTRYITTYVNTGSRGIKIGADDFYPYRSYLSFNGSIDDVMVWNRTLTNNEIAMLYSLQINKYNSTKLTYVYNTSINNVQWTNLNLTFTDSSSAINSTFYSLYKNYVTNVFSNFSNPKYTIRPNFYGANVHGFSRMITDSYASWQQEKWNNSRMDFMRFDMSLGAIHSGLFNTNFEGWFNYTGAVTTSSGQNNIQRFGWIIETFSSPTYTYQRSNDSHSGNYSLFINVSNTGDHVFLKTADNFALRNGSFYNVSVWVKVNGSQKLVIQQVGGSFNACGSSTVSGDGTSWVFTSTSCNVTDITYGYRIGWDSLGQNESVYIDDFNITENGKEPDFLYIYGYNTTVSYWQRQLAFNKILGVKSNYIISYVPRHLAVWNSPLCDSTDIDYPQRCPIKNIDAFANTTLDFVSLITNNGTIYLDDIELEFWNEPEIDFFLDNLTTDDPIKSLYYVNYFNKTFNKIKSVYPSIPFYGIATAGEGCADLGAGTTGYNSTLFNSYLSNFSIRTNASSLHCYRTPLSQMGTATLAIVAKMGEYGSINPRIIWDEWNLNGGSDGLNIKITPSRYNEWESALALGYESLLNSRPDLITSVLYQWTQNQAYSSSYADSGHRYDMVSSPAYDNTLFPPYWITSNLTRYAASNGTTYNTTSDNSLVKIIGTNKNNTQSVILFNIDSDYQNVTLNLTNVSELMDVTDGILYDTRDNQAQGIIMKPLQSKYLTVPYLSNEGGVWYWENYLGENIRAVSASDNLGLIVNYTYSYSSQSTNGYYEGSMFILHDVIGFIVNFFALFPVLGTILAVVVLISVIYLVIMLIWKFKGNSDFSG